MIKNIKKFYVYIYNHNILNKVAATVIGTLILYVIRSLGRLIINLSYDDLGRQIADAFSIKLPLWVSIIGVAILVSIWFIVGKLFPRKRSVKPHMILSNSTPTAISEVLKDSKDVKTPAAGNSFVFDSSDTDIVAYSSFGEREWDNQLGELIGKQGTARFEVQHSIITVERTNLDGRYVIRLLEYYPKLQNSNLSQIRFVGRNISAPNPRSFNVRFLTRSLRGKHKIMFAFIRAESSEWLNHFEIETSDPDWVKQGGSCAVSASESFVIEIHSFMISKEPGIFQIKDLKIEEYIPKIFTPVGEI